jgi:7-keto-8-aminopelargonate synthetase-like enzyme
MLEMQSAPGPETVISGRRYLYFAGTAYYALQGHPEVIRAACEAIDRYGIASATTRAWFGSTPPLLEAEQQAARFFGTEAAFHYATGYAGTQLLLAGLAAEFDLLAVDELAHYSVLEAARGSTKPLVTFRHADADDLRRQLRLHLRPGMRPLVLSDGVFPVLGRVAPVAEYRALLKAFPGAGLAIDDAHGAGVLGDDGRGTYQAENVLQFGVNLAADERPAGEPALFCCATASKAFGGYGGLIAGSRRFIEQIQRGSHWYEGASSPPVPVAAATACGIRLLIEHPEMRQRLRDNVRAIKQGMAAIGLTSNATAVPIVCLQIGTAERMRQIQQTLADQGILVAYAAAYSGLGSEGALRLAVCSEHTPAMIDQLIETLRRLL